MAKKKELVLSEEKVEEILDKLNWVYKELIACSTPGACAHEGDYSIYDQVKEDIEDLLWIGTDEKAEEDYED